MLYDITYAPNQWIGYAVSHLISLHFWVNSSKYAIINWGL